MKRTCGVTEHLWELNPCIDIKMPTSAISTFLQQRASSIYDVAWLRDMNCVRSTDTQKELVQMSWNKENLCFWVCMTLMTACMLSILQKWAKQLLCSHTVYDKFPLFNLKLTPSNHVWLWPACSCRPERSKQLTSFTTIFLLLSDCRYTG